MSSAFNPRAYKTGARLSPRHVLAAAQPHQTVAFPAQFAYVPKKLNLWGNDTYGDCVTAEEAFAKSCYAPEILISDQEAIAWARQNGFLNGADLPTVLDLMTHQGFVQSGTAYDDGGKLAVDYSNEAALQSAIASGPVKIAIDAAALPSNAGPPNGWYAFGGAKHPNTDHCVSLCGYGPTAWLFQQLGLPVPAGLPAAGYLLFTWGSIGFVDHAWIMGTCAEAWVRSPTTVIVGPQPAPVPTPTPTPVNPPMPPPAPSPAPAVPTFDQALACMEAEVGPLRPRVRMLLVDCQEIGDAQGVGNMPFPQALIALASVLPAEVIQWLQQFAANFARANKGWPGPRPGPRPWFPPVYPPYYPPYYPTPQPMPMPIPPVGWL